MIQTRRKEMIELLEEQEMSVKQLADSFRVTVKEVVEDLKHISQTVKHLQKKLIQKWATCNECGFVFKDRDKFSRPTKCPECRSEDITEPVFNVNKS